MAKGNILSHSALWLLPLCMSVVGCISDIDYCNEVGLGSLTLSFGNISLQTETRSTPVQLGIPVAEDFSLSLIASNGQTHYNGRFTAEEFNLPVGKYTVETHYGDNPRIALDAPFFQGWTNVEIRKDEHVTAKLTAYVANALVSVRFGVDEAERMRFDRFYSEYALFVYNGDYGVGITNYNPSRSVYFPAGAHVTLLFKGTLRDGNQEISCDLLSDDFPTTFNAADHAIVTLSLPDPESALAPNIKKVELETVTLEETIPLSWLPVPQATPAHHYDEQGNLVGTDLVFTNSYPDMKWKVVVTNWADVAVRTATFDGSLNPENTVAYTSSSDWPYLPSGTYKATYYLVAKDGAENMTSSRTFSVPSPALSLTLDAFTSYDKYLAEDLDAANEAGPNGEVGYYGRKIRDVSARLKVADNIIDNSNYASLQKNITTTVDGTTLGSTAGFAYFLANTGDLSRARHTISASGSFDGGTATGSKSFEVTGIPYFANSQETFSDWTAQKKGQWASEAPDNSITAMTSSPGTCYWFKGESSGQSTANIYTPKFNIPSDIGIFMQYDIWLYVPSSADILIGGTDYLYINYGPVANTNTTPSSDTAKPQNTTWTTFSNNGYTFTNSISYLSWQWHSDTYIFTGYYWWGINNVKILYR